MAPPSADPQVVNLLSELRDQLKQLNDKAGDTKAAREGTIKNRTTSTVQRRFNELNTVTGELNKSFTKAEKDFEKTAKLFGRSFTEIAKDIATDLNPSKKAIKKFTDSLDEFTEGQSENYRELSKNTKEYIQNNKGATANIKSAMSAYKDYITVLKDVANNNRAVSAKDLDAANKFTGIINKLYEGSKGKVDVLSTLSPAQKKVLDDFNKLSAGTELEARELKTLLDSTKEVGKGFQVVSKTTEVYADGLEKSMSSVKGILVDGFTKIMKGLAEVVAVGGRVAIADLKAQGQNAIGQSHYSVAQGLGLSETQLAEFTGQNRLALRVMGKGVSDNPVANGQVSQMFGAANNLGFTGEQAAKIISTSFDSIMKMGLEPSVQNVSNTMNTMYKTMQETGMSFDQLNDQVADLSKSPAFLQLVHAKGYKGQMEQIEVLDKMLKQSGYSTDYLKEMLEIDKQAKYQGIVDAVKGMIGVQLLGKQLGETPTDIGIQKELRGRGAGGMAQLYANGGYDNKGFTGEYKGKTYNNARLTDVFGKGIEGGTNFANYAQDRRNQWNQDSNILATNASANPNMMGGLMMKELMNHWMGLAGAGYQQQDAAEQAMANKMSIYGTLTPTQAQKDAYTGSNDKLIHSVNDVHNAFTDLIPVLTNAKKLNIEQQAEGVVKNPLGQAMSGVKTILSGAAQVGLGVWGSRTLGKLISVAGGGGKGFLGRGLGSLGGLARGALGSLGSAGAWLGRGALGTGEAILGSAALPLTGAVGTGIGVGYGFDKLFPNNPLAKLGGKIADWSAPDETAMPTPFDTNAYRKAHGIDINGAHQMTGVGVKTNDIDKLSDSKAVTPAGDTVGDLLSTLVTQMNKMIDINSKQLDLTDDTHKEYMDWLVKQSTDTRVKNAENQGRNTVMGGH